jgi:MraZ protein
MANEAVETDVDAQGRILLPEVLRTKASLSKNVVFAGSLNRIELWNTELYAKTMDALEQNAELIAEQFGSDLPGKQSVHA